jgi:hypothetical protein
LSNPDDLYFVRVKRGRVKIGRSANVAARVRVLQSASPMPLVLLGTVAGAGWQESLWHAAFASLRRTGEWFDYADDLPAAIRLAVAGDDWTAALQDEPPSDWDDVVRRESRPGYFKQLIGQRAQW